VTDLLTIVPTRSRPEAVGRVVAAWDATGAFEQGAQLLFVIDYDDPRFADYLAELTANARDRGDDFRGVLFRSIPRWKPLVPKLDEAAKMHAELSPDVFALGFAGDDHLPRTPGWVGRYVATLRRAGTGIVYCDDGYQGQTIPTQWAMTADIVRTLGRMVPAPVEHLYCDNAVRDLGLGAECLHYLGDVLIEHMHPVARKAETDEQYERVNGREQFRKDRAAYRGWARGALADDVRAVRALIEQGVPA
jgi:hypothetical protein